MSTGTRVASAVDYVDPSFEKLSARRDRSRSTSVVLCPSVLLVGRNGSWASIVLKLLRKFGCELSFEPPQKVTSAFVKSGGYDVVLLDSSVPQEQRRALTETLAGSDVSVFYTFPVEYGCWWLPALRRGKDCRGEPAFRRSEFPSELERDLRSLAES
jgi:hypothetical protein